MRFDTHKARGASGCKTSFHPLLLSALIIPSLLCGGCHSAQRVTVTLSVAASLQDTITEVESAYQREHGKIDFRNNFGSSGTLAQEIEQGAPVDMFLSAGTRPVDALDKQGLLAPGTRHDLLRNSLVLIAPAGSQLHSFADLASKAVKLIAIGDPQSVPAGQYGQQTLHSLHLDQLVRSRLVLCKDVRQVLTYVERGEVDAGLVYSTDALISKDVRIVEEAPESAHAPIVYPLAIVRGGRNQQTVCDFAAFLNSPAARAIFQRHGFRMA